MSEAAATQEKIKKTSGSNNLIANMFLGFIITFAAGTTCFENFMPEKFITLYSGAVIALCFVTWLALSFISGTRKKWQFAVYAALFWILPQVIIYLADNGPEVFRKSITMYLLSEFSLILTVAPAESAGGVFGVGVIPFTVIIILLCAFSFLGGYLLADKRPKK